MEQNKKQWMKQWMEQFKDELSNIPLKTNALLGFIMMALEKLMDVDFECPCSPPWSQIMALLFFIVPPVLSIEIMLAVRGRPWKDTLSYHIISSSVPAVIWLFLVFMDGQYFACLTTDWEGKYVGEADKWCEPMEETRDEPLMRSKRRIMYSQFIGSMLLISICVGLGIYICHETESPRTTIYRTMRKLNSRGCNYSVSDV